MFISVFDKLIWHTIGPKSFLFGTAQFSLWASGTINYDYVVTNSINCLLTVFAMVHTLTIIEPFWPMLQNVSKPLTGTYSCVYEIGYVEIHAFKICYLIRKAMPSF